MKHFKLNEFTKSATAIRKHINNSPSLEVINNIEALVANILDPLREAYGKPIVVTSGYRCPLLNKSIGGSKTSQHVLGQAADIRTIPDTPEENKKLFDLILSMGLPFDLLINEYNYNWVHVSYSNRNRHQILKTK